MVWLVICLFVLFVFILSLFTKIYTTIHYIHQANEDLLKLKIRLLGFIVIRRELPLTTEDMADQSNKTKDSVDTSDIEENSLIKTYKKYKELIKKIINSKPLILKFLSKVSVHHLSWKTNIGTGDASLTGILSGGLWSVKGAVIGMAMSHMKVKEQPDIEIVPLFQHKFVYSEFKCMTSVRLGQTIYAIFQLARHFQGSRSSLAKKTA